MAHKILLINTKGGCGKTTLSTNLCAYFISHGIKTALHDYDPQGSSIQWNELRKNHPELPPILQVTNASIKPSAGQTRSFQMRTEPDTQIIIMDTPAGVGVDKLQEYVRMADSIIIPVMPSALDIHAVARFIQTLLIQGQARHLKKRIAIVANRVRTNTLIYHSLEKFLAKLSLPLVTHLRDTQNYIHAAQWGMGIHELQGPRYKQDHEHWEPLVRWLEEGIQPPLRISRVLDQQTRPSLTMSITPGASVAR